MAQHDELRVKQFYIISKDKIDIFHFSNTLHASQFFMGDNLMLT